MNRAVKVRIYPTNEQQEFLDAQFGAVRFIYNRSLHIKNHFYRKKGINLSPTKELKALIAVAKKHDKYKWLTQFDSIALQESTRNLKKAFDGFFNPALNLRFPQFKRKHGKQSSYHCMSIDCDETSIKIPKLKTRIKAKMHRSLEGKLKSITLSKSATGKYYASLLFDVERIIPEKPTHLNVNQIKGFDLGLRDYLIDSDGVKIPNPRFLLRAARNLRKKQQSLSRKKKGSRNRVKARILVAKAHEKLTNARHDFQHKLSKLIVDESQAVIFEKLKSSNMIKNKKLAKHIADAAWHSFIVKVRYKSEWAGKYFTQLSQWFPSSKTCSCCGHKLESLSLTVRHWTCPECHTLHDRDHNAGMNIKAAGIIDLKAAGLTVSA